jgi:tetratricopeptide (TPR) repeat protein
VLCGINRLERNYERAREYGEKGLDLAESMGLRRYRAFFLLDLAWMYLAMQDYEKAFQNNETCTYLFEELEDNYHLAYAKINSGIILNHRGETEKARETWIEAKAIAEAIDHSVALKLVQQRLAFSGD